MEGILLLLLFAVFVYGFVQQIKRDAFQAAFLFYLFVYAIFALLGYIYRPQISQSILAYFGPNIAVHATIFITLSMLGVVMGLRYISPKIARWGRLVEIKRLDFDHSTATFIIAILLIIAQATALGVYWNVLNYQNASNVDFIESQDIGYKIWSLLYHISNVFFVLFYALLRYNFWVRPPARRALAIVSITILSLFVISSYRIANRGEMVSLFNAILFVELIRYRMFGLRSRPPIFKGILLASAVIIYGKLARDSRGADQSSDLDWLSTLVLQDYYAPAHMLFAAIFYHIIDPLLVIASNTTNLIPGLGLPYLQFDITEIFNQGITTRAASYAFYILTEGYLFCGDMGFLYNTIIISVGMGFWRLLSSTRSSKFNALVLPIIALDVTNICRGQSVYFIKLLFYHLAPALVIIFFSTGYFYSGLRRKAK
jgi:hypothetical protein